jgi:predicted MFS family arabinose efflux permease
MDSSIAAPTSQTTPHPSRVRALRHAHLAVAAAFVALGTAAGNWGSRVPDVKSDLGLSESAIGIALVVLSVGAVIGSWAGGWVVRRLGTKRVVRAAWFLLGVVVLAPGLASTWLALAIALGAFGLAIGVLDVSMNAAGVRLEAVAGRSLMNGLHAGWSAGVLFGAAFGVVAVRAGWSTGVHFGLAGALIALAAIVLGRWLPDGRPDSDGDTRACTRPTDPTSRRRLVALAAICGFVFLAEGALLDWSGILVRETFDGGEQLGALAVIGVAAGGLAGRLAGDRLTIRVGPAALVRASAVLAAIALTVVLAVPVAVLAPLLVVLVGFGLAPAVPLAFAAAGRRYGSVGISVVTTAGYGCYLVGPAVIGVLAEQWGLRAALALPVVLVAAVAALAWSTGSEHGPTTETPHPEPR